MGTPKYVQIAEVLQRRIAHGDYLSGALPGAPKLMQEFGISYMTTRQAMQKLIDDGTVIRVGCSSCEIITCMGKISVPVACITLKSQSDLFLIVDA